MVISKKNGDIISFLKQKNYIMIDNNLGSGSFGRTVLLKDPDIDELFVSKKYEPKTLEIRDEFYKNFLDEIRILYKMNHPNIVRIYNYYAYKSISTGYILMEYINGVTIDKYLKEYDPFNSNGPTPDSVFSQLIDAFTYIEKHGVIHRDIREGNILIDAEGTVKVIDFGIGKAIDTEHIEDSLRSQINRMNSDTLPQEYFEKKYTSLTDMFYLAELFNRLLKNNPNYNEITFSYEKILNTMMQKNPENRYAGFDVIQKLINTNEFEIQNFSEKDKQIYRSFVDKLHKSIREFTENPRFNVSPEKFSETLHNALKDNLFEEFIQNSNEVIDSIVSSDYFSNPKIKIDRASIINFLRWFEGYDFDTRKLILQNILAKLSTIPVNDPFNDFPY